MKPRTKDPSRTTTGHRPDAGLPGRDEVLPDSSLLAACRTRTDTIQRVMKDIVDSCQILLDSALLYSPEHYFYYAQKATLYACGAYYQEAARWMEKALEKKDLPELRLGAGMFLQKAGRNDKPSLLPASGRPIPHPRHPVVRRPDQLRICPDPVRGKRNGSTHHRQPVTDTLARKQLQQMTENPQEALEVLFPDPPVS